jgi:hypothetical protein
MIQLKDDFDKIAPQLKQSAEQRFDRNADKGKDWTEHFH